jgi:hypothetical protein
MKVWELTGTGKYKGGIAIVAASTAQRALEVVETHPHQKDGYLALNFRADRTRELPDVRSLTSKEQIITYYDWQE